jgi:hypothetical protein
LWLQKRDDKIFFSPLPFVVTVFGSGIRIQEWDPGSEIREKIRIRDGWKLKIGIREKQPGSAKLQILNTYSTG